MSVNQEARYSSAASSTTCIEDNAGPGLDDGTITTTYDFIKEGPGYDTLTKTLERSLTRKCL
jgi:hypothetical protein